jgi:hypothetical protein
MLLLKGKDLSYTTIQDTFYGLDEFFDFCDQWRESSTPVRFIADINVHIAKELEAWYLQNYPGRSVNRKRFGRIRAIVNRLKHDFGELPEVGPSFPWPSGPANNDTPTESYRIETFNALSEAALRDIKFVIQEMRRFSDLLGSCPIIRFPELSLADVFLQIGIEEDERRIEQGVDQFWSQTTQRIRKKEIVRVAAKRYGMLENEIVALYFSQGVELSRSGVRFPSYKVTEERTLQGMSVAESADIAMCTFASEFPSWPLEMPHAEASRLISFESFKNPREKPRAHITAYRVNRPGF